MSSKPGCLDDFETFARQRMAPSEFAYYSTGADDEVTLRRNREAFDRHGVLFDIDTCKSH